MSDSKSSGRSLKHYASGVFQESLVTGLSSIVQTDNICRKLLKIFVLLFCIVGFLYQSITFVRFILTYPSVVDIKILNPNQFMRPAYTFCNSNGVKRSKFCIKYKAYCEHPNDTEAFCEDHPGYCGENYTEVMFPKEDYMDFEKNMTRQDLLDLGHSLKSFLVNGKGDSDGEGGLYDDVSGPFMLSKGNSKDNDGFFGCYTKYGRVDNSLRPKIMTKKGIFSEPVDSFEFDVEEHEKFLSDAPPSALFSIHSPFVFVNPFMNGILLKPGRGYKIHLMKEQELLLPYPYDTNCLNYTEVWEKNNRKGPRTQDMCRHRCTLDISLKLFGCVYPGILYPHEEEMCKDEDPDYLPGINPEDIPLYSIEWESCKHECRDDCLKVSFLYDVQDRYAISKKHDYKIERNRHIYVDIFVEDPEVVGFYHRPQYQDVEVFSYIGGFMGCWLGISLVAVADFIESVIRVIARFFTNRRSQISP